MENSWKRRGLLEIMYIVNKLNNFSDRIRARMGHFNSSPLKKDQFLFHPFGRTFTTSKKEKQSFFEQPIGQSSVNRPYLCNCSFCGLGDEMLTSATWYSWESDFSFMRLKHLFTTTAFLARVTPDPLSLKTSCGHTCVRVRVLGFVQLSNYLLSC